MEIEKDIREFEVPLTKKDVALILRIPILSMDRLVRAKKISHFRVGTLIRFRAEDVNDYLKDNSFDRKNEEKTQMAAKINNAL